MEERKLGFKDENTQINMAKKIRLNFSKNLEATPKNSQHHIQFENTTVFCADIL